MTDNASYNDHKNKHLRFLIFQLILDESLNLGKNFFSSLGRACRLFDTALVLVLACGALAMCLQMP